MCTELLIATKEELFLYLDDINQYIDSIILYHQGYNELDINEIVMYLSCIEEIIQSTKVFLNKELY